MYLYIREAKSLLYQYIYTVPKVIIHKSRGEVSLVEQDTIEYAT